MITRRAARKMTIGSLEALDQRVVPATGGSLTATAAQVAALNARGAQVLKAIYQQFATYEAGGEKGAFTSPSANRVFISGNSVGVDVRFGTGDLNTLVVELKAAGMRVTGISARTHTVEGFLPIADLPVVASNSHTVTISPVYRPSHF